MSSRPANDLSDVQHRGFFTERLRFTPGPSHSEAMMRELTGALVEIWDRLEMREAA